MGSGSESSIWKTRSADVMARCTLSLARPVYEEFEGWQTDISAARALEELPAAARGYVAAVERIAGVRVEMASVGPERQQIAKSAAHAT